MSKDKELRDKIIESLEMIEAAISEGNTDHIDWYISVKQHLECADSDMSFIIND